MSIGLAFWKGDTPDAAATYLRLADGQLVAGVEPVDRGEVDAALRTAFASWSVDHNIWVFQADEHGNGPAFDLFVDDYIVQFSCYGLEHEQLNEIIDVMNGLGFPLYDPQLRERFAAP